MALQRYEPLRAALLDILTGRPGGMTWADIVGPLERALPPGLFPHRGSMQWHAKWVQLDLEARGLIERVSTGAPLRFRCPIGGEGSLRG